MKNNLIIIVIFSTLIFPISCSKIHKRTNVSNKKHIERLRAIIAEKLKDTSLQLKENQTTKLTQTNFLAPLYGISSSGVSCLRSNLGTISDGYGFLASTFGIGSLAYQCYNQDFSLKKSLFTGSCLLSGLSALYNRHLKTYDYVFPGVCACLGLISMSQLKGDRAKSKKDSVFAGISILLLFGVAFSIGDIERNKVERLRNEIGRIWNNDKSLKELLAVPIGAYIWQGDRKAVDILKKAIKYDFLPVNVKCLCTSNSSFRTSLLHVAAHCGHGEFITFLINHGANVNKKNYKRLTPLHCAIFSKNEEAVRPLLKAGADLFARIEDKENEDFGKTALDCARIYVPKIHEKINKRKIYIDLLLGMNRRDLIYRNNNDSRARLHEENIIRPLLPPEIIEYIVNFTYK